MSSSKQGFVKSFLFKTLLVVICAGMALWGASTGVPAFRSLFAGTGSNFIVAKSRAVSPFEFDRRIENYLRNINTNSETLLTKGQAAQSGQIDDVFNIVRLQTGTLGFADSIGVQPSVDAVKVKLEAYEDFKNPLSGEFDETQYKNVLLQNRLSPQDFEQQLFDDIQLSTLDTAASGAIIAPKLLSSIQAVYLAESREVEWFVVDTAQVPEPESPTATDVKSYYDENLTLLAQPERRGIDLLKMSADDFVGSVVVTEQEISTIYEASKSSRFSEPDQRTYTILNFADRELAKAAVGQLAGGSDIADLQGVVLSETKTGLETAETDQALREGMFGPGRQAGTMIGPREVNGEWQVARLISIQPGAAIGLEFVSDIIREERAREQAQNIMNEKINALDELIAAGYPLSEIGAQMDLPIISYSPVDADGKTENGLVFSSLLASSEVFEEVFELPAGEVTYRGDSDGAIFVASTRTIVEPYTPEFETLEEEIRIGLIQRNRAAAVQTWISDMEARITSGESSLSAEAEAVNGLLQSPAAPVTRLNVEQSGLPSALINGVFGAEEGRTFSIPSRSGDRYLVAQLNKINAPSEAETALLSSTAEVAMTSSLQSDILSALRTEVLNAVDVKVNTPAFNSYKAGLADPQ
ncbi:MAG: peptidyl-prolyl cis-trans isomerase [Hyphomonas sp.]